MERAIIHTAKMKICYIFIRICEFELQYKKTGQDPIILQTRGGGDASRRPF